jgi:hypothetical protein
LLALRDSEPANRTSLEAIGHEACTLKAKAGKSEAHAAKASKFGLEAKARPRVLYHWKNVMRKVY